jgi:hypothetical protein
VQPGERAASVHRVATSKTQLPSVLTRRRTEHQEVENSVTEAFWRASQEERIRILDGQAGSFEWRHTIASLFGRCVALLAMKHGRAPLRFSPALKGMLRKGFPNDVDELGNFARRCLFLGEARMPLGELRDRPAAAPST